MIEGRYFFPNAAHFVEARAEAVARVLRITGADGAVLAEVPGKEVRATARLASLPRRLDLPGGSRFDTPDNDGADALLRALGRWRRGRFTDGLERAWPVVLASLLVTLAAGYYLMVQAIPEASEWLALRTPPAVAHIMTEQTLMALDRFALGPTKLSKADQDKANRLFQAVAAHARGGRGAYRLVFRGVRGAKDGVGPNAFALPDGTVVMTDPLWPLVKDDAEIEGVFAHEMSHVDHAHGLQRIYAASLFPAILALVTGDVSNVSQMAAVLPGIIAQSAYSRSFETQADDDGAATLRSMGLKPSHMADLLERMEKSVCKKADDCVKSWLGDHPDTDLRAVRLRREDLGPLNDRDSCWKPWITGITLRCLGFTTN
jgi:Zn-dependent protease with chaperone function